jgi:two-component system chemotaxis response regulator CheY
MAAKILISDDAAFIREILAQLLTEAGYEIIGEAGNGAEAIQLALTLQPDLIIMDIIMPKVSGIEATKEILKSFPEARILAISTEGNETLVMRALDAGCLDFVTKPFIARDLLSRVQKLLENSKNI